MARPKGPVFWCGMCDLSFTSKADLTFHTENHAENSAPQIYCETCKWPFDDELALETHKISTSHGSSNHKCDDCLETLPTSWGLQDHKMRRPGCQKAFAGVTSTETRPTPALIRCDRCQNDFKTRREYNHHRSYKVNSPCADHNQKRRSKHRGDYIDSDLPNTFSNATLGYEDAEQNSSDDSDSDAPSDLTVGKEWCGKCKSRFESKAQYNGHLLRCKSRRWTTKPVSIEKAPEVSEGIQAPLKEVSNSTPLPQKRSRPPAPAPAPGMATPANPTQTSSAPASDSSMFACNANGCHMSFKSEPALRIHKADKHGVGGKRLDTHGGDSWMLSQRAREELKRDGLLRQPSPTSTRSRNRGGRGATPGARPPIPVFHSPPPPQFTPVYPQVQPSARDLGTRMPPHPHTPAHHAPTNGQPTSRHMGDTFDMEQAHHIKDKILRLLIQSDILIHHDGKMMVGGIDWTRIGCSRQADVVGMFDGMCHLPKVLQSEYLPPPKALQDQYNIQYPASEFEPSPDRDRYKPGLGVVALTCSKVVLPDGLKEVVKIAAVDLVTCRILMDYLVCTDSSATVANWRSNETGLFTWNDMEQARLNGFKVLKGWAAARAALWKFIDKETIIVGHNLRSDLDSLRMIHGRAVDIAKVAEKAANGPLSKIQVGLDSLCRDYPKVTLTSDPNYGRDVLMSVFAVREMGLWIIKNKDTFEQKLRQKSMDYQRLVPRTAAI